MKESQEFETQTIFSDDVISSPIAYENSNWYQSLDQFSFDLSRSNTFSPENSFSFEASANPLPDISNEIIQIEKVHQTSKPSNPAMKDIQLNNPTLKKKKVQKPQSTITFRPFANCFSTEITVQILKNQMSKL